MKRKRTYAAYWEFPDEAARDKGIVADLILSLEASVIQLKPRSLRSRGRDDPPDCEALDLAGRRVAFELSEIVDAQAIMRHTRREGLHYREYSEASFLALLDARLTAKLREETDLKGGPYHRRVLVLHSDEGLLDPEFCSSAVRGRTARYIRPWTDVFLIFPPPPHFTGTDIGYVRKCPIITIPNEP